MPRPESYTEPMDSTELVIRPARTQDVHAIRALVEPLARERVLLQKEAVAYYEAIQEFMVAEAPDGSLAGFGTRVQAYLVDAVGSGLVAVAIFGPGRGYWTLLTFAVVTIVSLTL